MLLPGSSLAALLLLLFSIACFGLWPNLFKLAGRWRFELFSVDFAVGALVVALLAAYTLGTLGSDLGFSDSMLVAGTRIEVTAVVAGGAFALGNMCYLCTIALIGLANATLLTFGIFGCGIAVTQMLNGRYAMPGAALAALGITAALAYASERTKRGAATKSRSQQTKVRAPIPNSTKAAILGILAGTGFLASLLLIRIAQPDQLGIGAYGGVLLATVGLLFSTLALNFFFMNISVEGGTIGYATYLAGTRRDHAIGAAAGAIWAAGALALYAAYTGTAPLTALQAWLGPFGGALLAVVTGLLIWQKAAQKAAARRMTVIAAILMVAGVAFLIFKGPK